MLNRDGPDQTPATASSSCIGNGRLHETGFAATVPDRPISTPSSCGCSEAPSTRASERVFLLPQPRQPRPCGCMMLKPHLDLACVVTSLTRPYLGDANASTHRWNDSRLRTAVPKPRATGPSPSFLIYCLTSHTRLLAPRFHAHHALFPFFPTAGRFRHFSRLKLDGSRSLVHRRPLCLMNT